MDKTGSSASLHQSSASAGRQIIKTRLDFLQSSAQLLLVSSPSTSSFLEAQRTKLAAEHDQSFPTSRREKICSACGSIMISGWNMKLVRADGGSEKSRLKARKTLNSDKRVGRRAYECQRCHRVTRFFSNSKIGGYGDEKILKANERPPHMIATTSAQIAAEAPEFSSNPATKDGQIERGSSRNGNIMPVKTATAISGNAGGKKRAKARKGGLQAMLTKARVQQSQSGSLELDLMDFLKND